MNKILFNILLAAVCLACLFSCKTSEQLYNKAKTKDIVKVAKLARIDFPCTTTKIDTVITVDTLFDFLEVECNPQAIHDTIKTTVTKTVTVKVPQKVVTIRTIQKVEDSAKIITMQAAITDANATILAEHNRGNEYKAIAESERNSKKWWRKWAVITWGIIIVLIAVRLLASKIKL
jgi:hypothetical protein